MRILLISLNTVDVPFPVFPIGLAYLHSALEASGHEVDVFDLLIQDSQALQDLLESNRFELIGLSLRNIDNVRADDPQGYLAQVENIVAKVRAVSSARLVLGGAGFSIFPQELMELLPVDFGLAGEGEYSLPALASVLERGADSFEEIPGLLYRAHDGAIIKSSAPARPILSVPPMRPPTAWVQAYLAKGAIFNSQTQRGCPLHCSYCTYPIIEGARTRARQPKDLVAELRYLEELGVRYVFFVDSVFNTSRAHVRRIADAIGEADLKMEWGCFLRPQGWQVDDFKSMQQCGMRHVEFGTDSFCDTMLANYGKSFRMRQVVAASQAAAEARVHFCHFLIFGGPGETVQTLEQSLVNSREWADGLIFAFPGVRVYPGTPVWQKLKNEGYALADNLLQPFFYCTPELPAERIMERLRGHCKEDTRWYPGDLPEAFFQLVPKLRRKGIQGPLWEYFDVLRRLHVNTH